MHSRLFYSPHRHCENFALADHPKYISGGVLHWLSLINGEDLKRLVNSRVRKADRIFSNPTAILVSKESQ